jgi:hypothetical protein
MEEFILVVALVLVLIVLWKQPKQTKTKEGFKSSVGESGKGEKGGNKSGIALLMRKPIDLMLWLEHHRKAGIDKFYIRLEDSPGIAAFLKSQKDVWFEEAESDKENNYTTLQKRQIDFVNKILPMARKDGLDWLFHTDADELLEGDIRSVLGNIPTNKKVGKMKNAEAVYSEDEPTCFSTKKFIRCDKGGPCTAYVNGKGCGRTEPGVQLAGPHDFVYTSAPNSVYDIPFEDLHVLHYDSCTLGSWMEKFTHLSKNAKLDDIVFGYYKQSIEAAKEAAKVYREHKMREDMKPEWSYERPKL